MSNPPRWKSAEQVGVRGMDLDTVEPRPLGQLRGRCEPLYRRADLLLGHRHRPAEPLGVSAKTSTN
jgi:hypothetical protein